MVVPADIPVTVPSLPTLATAVFALFQDTRLFTAESGTTVALRVFCCDTDTCTVLSESFTFVTAVPPGVLVAPGAFVGSGVHTGLGDAVTISPEFVLSYTTT